MAYQKDYCLSLNNNEHGQREHHSLHNCHETFPDASAKAWFFLVEPSMYAVRNPHSLASGAENPPDQKFALLDHAGPETPKLTAKLSSSVTLGIPYMRRKICKS